MGRVFAEFRSQFAQLDIKPLPQLQSGMVPVTVAANTRVDEPSAVLPREGVKQESVAAAVTGTYVQDALRKAIGDDAIAAPVVPAPVLPPVVVAPPVTVPPVTVPPVVVVPPVPAPPAQLVWGRWGGSSGLASDFTVARTTAALGREVTVSNGDYILYRTEPAAGVTTPAGNFSFNLQQSYAQLVTPASALLPATVTNGTLSIDFGGRQFATSLNLNSVPTGAVNLSASGYIRGDGIFVGRTDQQAVAGAVSADAKTAGYFFEKSTASGMLSGVTLWGR
jgi:hypothetical protein